MTTQTNYINCVQAIKLLKPDFYYEKEQKLQFAN